jgi:hypothetical protein
VFFTESGYNTAVNAAPSPGITETGQAKYLTRAVANTFNMGVSKTFVYELVNYYSNPARDYPTANLGLLREDFSYKPAAHAFKNLIELLQDPGAPFTPGRLDFTLAGNDGAVQTILLQKGNGDYYLVLWQEVVSFDASSRQDIAVPADSVTLTLNTPILSAQAFLPNASTAPVQSFAADESGRITQLTVNVPDELLLLRLRPELIPGDANFDWIVDYADFEVLFDHFGQSGDVAHGDLNGDHVINFVDFQILERQFGLSIPAAAAPTPVAVPEPTCALFVVLTCTFLQRRRRALATSRNRKHNLWARRTS